MLRFVKAPPPVHTKASMISKPFSYPEHPTMVPELFTACATLHGTVASSSCTDSSGAILTGNTNTRFGYEAKEADTLVGDTDFHARKYRTSNSA